MLLVGCVVLKPANNSLGTRNPGHVTGDRFRHGTKLVRFRPDKAPKQCTFEQIAPQTLPRNVKLLLG